MQVLICSQFNHVYSDENSPLIDNIYFLNEVYIFKNNLIDSPPIFLSIQYSK